MKELHNDLNIKQKKTEIFEKENANLKTHLENIDNELAKHQTSYDEDYTKRKEDVDDYKTKMETHLEEITKEIEKLDVYREQNKELMEKSKEREEFMAKMTSKHDGVQSRRWLLRRARAGAQGRRRRQQLVSYNTRLACSACAP